MSFPEAGHGEFGEPIAALGVARIGEPPPAHWRDEGWLALGTDSFAIVEGALSGWAEKLNELDGVQAVRLDERHIAVRIAR